MPNDQQTGPPALPGDIIQVTTIGRRGALAIVEEVRASGVTGYMPLASTMGGPATPVPIRLRYGEFQRVGTAAVLGAELSKARVAAIETAQQVAAERAATAPPPDPDDLTPEWDVEVRFNGRENGKGVHRERVRADCPEEAYDRVTLPVMAHGGALCVTGLTIDEVKS